MPLTPISLSRIGTLTVTTAVATTSVAEVARRMEERNVGCVVVVRGAEPVGIVTDRDLVLRVLRSGAAPATTPVEQVMTHPLVCVPDDLDPIDAATRMRVSGVRRLPVVNDRRQLVGIVTMDDLVRYFGRGNAQVSHVLDLPSRPGA